MSRIGLLGLNLEAGIKSNQIAREYHHHHTDIPAPPNPIAYEPDACDYSPQHEGNHPKASEALATLLQAL
jgi:hypothetical protein